MLKPNFVRVPGIRITNKEVGDIFSMKYQAVSKAAKTLERLMKEKPDVKMAVEEVISNFEV